MTEIPKDELDDFLKRPLHAVLGTNRVDGPPQLSPVWYLYENGTFFISTPSGSAKHQNLRRDPRLGLCVDGGRSDARAAMIYGEARIVSEEPLPEEMRFRIIRAYYESEEEARAYYASIRDQPSVLIVLEPRRVITQDFRE